MESPKPNLLILTSHFPCGEGEDFLVQEIPYLAEFFTVSIVTADNQSEISHSLPKGVTFTRVPSFSWGDKAAFRMRSFFSKEYQRELAAAQQRGPVSAGFRSQTQASLAMGHHLASYIRQMDEFSSSTPLVLYACRYNYLAFAGTLVKKARQERGLKTTAVVRCHRQDLEAPLPLAACIDEGSDGIYCGGETAHSYYVEQYARSNLPSKYRVARLGTNDPNGLSPACKEGEPFHLVTRGIRSPKALSLLEGSLKQLSENLVRWTHLGEVGEDLSPVNNAADVLSANPHLTVTVLEDISPQQAVAFYQQNPVNCFFSPDGDIPSLLESMSCGVFPLSVDKGCVKDVVNDDHGLLLPADVSSQELSQVILLLSRMEVSQLALKAAKARKWWEDYYHNEKNFRKFAKQLLTEIQKD